jgi:hypothetical protein
MGWIVYSETFGIVRYYDTEKKAKAQVTGRNKKLFLDVLRNGKDKYDSRSSWAYCSWQDYEEIYKEFYARNKSHIALSASFQ